MHPNVSAYRLPTVRQSYVLSGRLSAAMKLAPNNRIHAPNRAKDMHPKAAYMHPNVSVYFAPNNRIHAPNRSIDTHPKGIDMHPKLSIDLHPTCAYFAPNRFGIHAPRRRIHAPRSFPHTRI